MESKYYTPAIEEFHVGFEYEAQEIEQSGSSVDWQEYVFEINDSLELLFKPNDWYELPRVKYLDKEGIESLKFKHIGAGWFESKELDCRVRKWKGLEVDIYKNWSHLNVTEQNELKCFTGEIKNKSEFKKILKQLRIIK